MPGAPGICRIKPARTGYSYYMFEVTAPYSSNFQVSEFGFYSAGAYQSVGGAAPTGTRINPMRVSAPAGYPVGEEPEKMFDGNTATKHFNGNAFPLQFIFYFDLPHKFVGYNWCTANDMTPARNPDDWNVYGSNDGTNWTSLDAQVNKGSVPTTTFTWAAGWALPA